MADNNLSFNEATSFLITSPVGIWGMKRDAKHSSKVLSIGETTEVISFERGLPIGVNPDDANGLNDLREVVDRVQSHKTTFYRREYLVNTNKFKVFPYSATNEDILDFKWEIVKL